jgi:uncharacterized coiled-coil protein SlyX
MKNEDIEKRLKELEINVAKHEAMYQERHRSIMLTLERVENSIKQIISMVRNRHSNFNRLHQT